MNFIKEKIIPKFESWEKSCLCKTPLNPDQLYIKCDSCEGWFHPECCNVPQNEIDELKDFFCDFCKKKE